MDECDNLVIEAYEELDAICDIEQQINDNEDDDVDAEIAKLSGYAQSLEDLVDNNVGDEQHQDDYLKKGEHFDDDEEEVFYNDTAIMGQTESKKSAKKYCANGGSTIMDTKETKGTAMSFGFRKKLNSTPKKFKKLLEGNHDLLKHKHKQDKCNNPQSDSSGHDEEIIRTVICNDDLNGNAAETLTTIHFEKMGAAAIATAAATATAIATANTQTTNTKPTTTATATPAATATATTQATNGNGTGSGTGVAMTTASSTTTTTTITNEQLPGANNRFGYRGYNIPRPASTGIIARQSNQHHQHNQQQQQRNDARDNLDNNNCGTTTTAPATTGTATNSQQPKGGLVSNLKRRSKSAGAGRTLKSTSQDVEDEEMPAKPTQPKTLTFNLNQNTTIEYQRRQFFEQPITTTAASTDAGYGRFMNHAQTIHTGMHTNVIVRPTARTAQTAYSKFTLQTVSLPKPEFPVAISLSATTPTTPSSNTFSPTKAPHLSLPSGAGGGGARAKELTTLTAAPLHHNTRHRAAGAHPLTFCASQPPHFDQKSVKQMTNNSTRRGFSGSREISADSGIASMDMAMESNSSTSSGGGSVAGMMSKRNASPKRSRSRPRHLQMVMSGRHKFEVRELDDPLSSENSSLVEPLSLPKLPAENQTMPLPLSGLVRSNTVLSRESYERNQGDAGKPQVSDVNQRNNELARNASEESESVDEEKLYLDNSTSEKSTKNRQFRDINTCSSKTSSPGSSIMSSWCNAGESLAVKDCSSLSVSYSEDSNKQQQQANPKPSANQQPNTQEAADIAATCIDLLDDDNSLINTDMQISTISSITETQTAPIPAQAHQTNTTTLNDAHNLEYQDNKLHELQSLHITEDSNTYDDVDNKLQLKNEGDRPKSFLNALNEAKFAEIALAGSKYLLDDETSPTDSLVSSTDSDDAGGGCDKLKKHKFNEELQEKDIDEISPELEMGSPISPGTPTHASRSLSFSECGNLIDDEIADQPALLFDNEDADGGGDFGGGGRAGGSHESQKEKTDTPTLMEAPSLRSLKSQSKARTALQQAIELSLRTPISIRKAVMERAESLDTLSPCESICSDDLMMDFETNSSMDSIDRSASIKSRSGSDLNNLDDTALFSEMERRGSDVMKELNTLLKVRLDRKTEKESVIAHLPARATRLLNRSRLQQQCPLNNADSDSSKSAHSVRLRSATGSRTSIRSSSANAATQATAAQQFHTQHHNFGGATHKSHHHKQLQQGGQQYQQQQRSQQQQAHHQNHLHQQRLQKRDTHSSSDDLMLYDKSFRNAMIQDVLQFKKQLLRLRRILQETETLNPFENDNGQLFASCGLDSKQLDDIDLASLTSSTTDDPMQELADLRRQVVYLQGQVDDRDRTIRLQRNLIEKLEAEKSAVAPQHKSDAAPKECITIATQTDRTRPPVIGAEGLSRSKPEFTSYTTYFPTLCCNDAAAATTATTIIRHQQQYPGNALKAMNQTRRHTVISATLTNYNHHHQQQLQQHQHPPQQPHHHSTSNLCNHLTGAATTTSAASLPATHAHAPNAAQLLPRRASIAWEAQPQQQPIYKPVRITLIGDPMLATNGTTTHNSTTTLNTNNNVNNNVYDNSNIYNNLKTNSLSENNLNNHKNCHSSSSSSSYSSSSVTPHAHNNNNKSIYVNGNANGYANANGNSISLNDVTVTAGAAVDKHHDLYKAKTNYSNGNINGNGNVNGSVNGNVNGNANVNYNCKAQNGYSPAIQQQNTNNGNSNSISNKHSYSNGYDNVKQHPQQQQAQQQQQQDIYQHKQQPTVTIV